MQLQSARRRRPERASWQTWTLVGGALFLGVALTVWLVHEPSEPVVAPPLVIPVLKRPHSTTASAATDAPENEAPAEEAPTLPVGTADMPEQLDRHMLEQGMGKAHNAVEKCHALENFVGTITVHVTISKSGNVQSTQLVSPEKTPTTDCVVKAVQRNASFPRFRGTLIPTTELTWPFLFREDGKLAF